MIGVSLMKKLLSLIMVLMMVILCSCSSDNNYAEIVEVHYKSRAEIGDFYIIDSYEELTKYLMPESENIYIVHGNNFYYSFNTDKYDEIFFENNSLVLVLFDGDSSSTRYKFKSVKVKDGILEMKIIKYMYSTILCDVEPWTSVVEVTKEEANNINDVNVIIKEVDR
jgi:hypothetical protein